MKKTIWILLIVILLTVLFFLYNVFFKINLKDVENYYQKNQFYDSGKDCNSFNSFFNRKLKKYKIAREYGSSYQYYQESIEKYGKDDEKYVQDELKYLVIGLYWSERNYNNDNQKLSGEEKEVIEHINNLYYNALDNEFGISKEDIENMLKKYNTGDGATDYNNIVKDLESYVQDTVTLNKEKINIENNPIEISNTKLTSNTLYNIFEGSITNKSSKTVYFVKIKVLFMDSSKRTIDTNWTYAVGAEGLAPGESKKFETSVKKDYSIFSAYPSVIDFNY